MSKKDIASAIGTIPETFSRLIQRLKRRDIIEWSGKEIVLLYEIWEEYPDYSI